MLISYNPNYYVHFSGSTSKSHIPEIKISGYELKIFNHIDGVTIEKNGILTFGPKVVPGNHLIQIQLFKEGKLIENTKIVLFVRKDDQMTKTKSVKKTVNKKNIGSKKTKTNNIVSKKINVTKPKLINKKTSSDFKPKINLGMFKNLLAKLNFKSKLFELSGLVMNNYILMILISFLTSIYLLIDQNLLDNIINEKNILFIKEEIDNSLSNISVNLIPVQILESIKESSSVIENTDSTHKNNEIKVKPIIEPKQNNMVSRKFLI